MDKQQKQIEEMTKEKCKYFKKAARINNEY